MQANKSIPKNVARILAVGLIVSTAGIIGFLAMPGMIGYYHLSRGGEALSRVIASLERETEFPCTIPPARDDITINKLNAAILHLQKAVRYNHNFAEAYLYLGRAYCLKGDYHDAITAYLVYTHLRQRNPLGHLELGFAYEREQMSSLAFDQWVNAGLTFDDLISIGKRSILAKQYEYALEWYNRAAIYDYQNAEFYLYLVKGMIYERDSLWSKALEAYQTSVTKSEAYHPPLTTSYFRIGYIQHIHFGDYYAAYDSFTAAINANNYLSLWDLANAYCYRGITLRFTGQPDTALQDFQAALATIPDHYCGLMELGKTNWEMSGNLTLAEEFIQKAISVSPEIKWAYRAMAEIYEEANLSEKALDMYEKVLELDPSDATSIQKIAELSHH